MMLHGTGRRFRLTAVAAALLISLTACGSAGGDPGSAASPAPTAPAVASESPPPEAPRAEESPEAEPPSTQLVMDPSRPVTLRFPTLDQTIDLMETGLREDGALEVPPGDEGGPASWYSGSATPGEAGVSVLLGHVNSLTDDTGVFYDLRMLATGDQVTVTREDGSTAVFEVYRSESYPKDAFPTRTVYFPVPGAELRLVTCDAFDDSTGLYPNNLVVFAKLVGTA